MIGQLEPCLENLRRTLPADEPKRKGEVRSFGTIPYSPLAGGAKPVGVEGAEYESLRSLSIRRTSSSIIANAGFAGRDGAA